MKQLEELKARLRDDWPFYARNCLKIVDKTGSLIPFEPKDPQMQLVRKLEAQRDAGEPMRAVILKARQIGYSTLAQGLAIQRATQRPNHVAFTVAQDSKTAGKLFEIGELMYVHLPDDPELEIKPPIRNRRHQHHLYFGEPSRLERERGSTGLNSGYLIDTAQEAEAGRGFTAHTLHLSEIAFWPDVRKLIALLSTVPDKPDTLILLESTANGFNHFKDIWQRAEEGKSGYIPHFTPWQDEPEYQRKFLDDMEREDFISSIGTGPYGENEPGLVELGCSPEQLNWRRYVIENRFGGDARLFMQEMPSTPSEAFLSSGQTVFSPILIERTLREIENVKAPTLGEFSPQRWVTIRGPYGAMEVPKNPKWQEVQTRREDRVWRVWEKPDRGSKDNEPHRPAGLYIVAMDPAGGDVLEPQQTARHAIVVIDHRTRKQMAEYVSQEDPDLAAVQAYLAACYYNDAWLVIEKTGGWGLSINQRIARAFKYPRVYQQRKQAARLGDELERLGWSTDMETKPLMQDTAKELLRIGKHGIRSRELALEMRTFIADERGRSGPEKGSFSDRLMAWMIAQQVANEIPLRTDRRPGQVTSTSTRKIKSRVAGY